MVEPVDMIVPMLREMRDENVRLHGATARRLDITEQRLGKPETQQVSFRQAVTADSLLSKLVTGELEQRIEQRERKVRGWRR